MPTTHGTTTHKRISGAIFATALICVAPALAAQESGPDELSFVHIPKGSPLPHVAQSFRQLEPTRVFNSDRSGEETKETSGRYHDQNKLGVGPANDSR